MAILKDLSTRDTSMVKIIEEAAIEYLTGVDIDEVASEVQMELEFLDIEDVYDRSGSTRDGYVDPGDTAWQIFGDAEANVRDT